MNLQMEINSLKQRVAELEQQAKQEQDFTQYGDTYWCINAHGGVSKETWNGYDIEKDMLVIGNGFRTEQEAEFVVEKLKAEAELRKYGRPFEYGEFNYCLLFDIDGNNFRTDVTSYCPSQGAIYFESEEKAQESVSIVGKERIKKYLFGVEDL